MTADAEVMPVIRVGRGRQSDGKCHVGLKSDVTCIDCRPGDAKVGRKAGCECLVDAALVEVPTKPGRRRCCSATRTIANPCSSFAYLRMAWQRAIPSVRGGSCSTMASGGLVIFRSM